MKVKLIKGYTPNLIIDKLAFDKMLEYIHQSKLEIGWLGCAERNEKGFYISDVFLFKQEVHSTTTEITTEGLSEFSMELLSQEDGIERWNNMRVWGHSHVDMSTSPSSQDEKQMDLFLENPNEFFIRIIGNKKEHFKIDIWDFETGIIYEDMDYEVDYDEETLNQIDIINKQIKFLTDRVNSLINPDDITKKSIENEIKSKVTEKKYVYNTQDWWKKDKKKENVRNLNVKSKVEEVFDCLTPADLRVLMENLECGGTSIDVYDGFDLTVYESYQLDEMVEDYFNTEEGIAIYNEWGEWY